MKEPDFCPLEFKPDADTRDRIEGRYLIPHPLIKRYFFEVLVDITSEHEKVSIKLVCLVSANKAIFRNITRFLTWDDCEMVRGSFWYPGEEVIQIQRVNYDEIQSGNYYSHLLHLLPVK